MNKQERRNTIKALLLAANTLSSSKSVRDTDFPEIPSFDTYQDALDWIAIRSLEYGGKRPFYASVEYKTAQPDVDRAYKEYKKNRGGPIGFSQSDMSKHGLRVGDKVFKNAVGSFMSQHKMTGKIYKSKNGFRVRLDQEMPVNKRGRISYVKTMPLDDSWSKVK